MDMPGIPVGGFKTVGQIDPTNPLVFYAGQNGLEIAVALLSTHTAGAPVVDASGRYRGFISELDVLQALELGQDLNDLTADEIMSREHIAVLDSMTIGQAIKIMGQKHFLNLPVERDGKVAYSITRHDLLRARIGLGPDIEESS